MVTVRELFVVNTQNPSGVPPMSVTPSFGTTKDGRTQDQRPPSDVVAPL